MTSLEECLPAEMRGRATITKIQAGLSGAGVYKVEHEGRAYALKVTSADAPFEEWCTRLATQRLAAESKVAPPIVYVDEGRRAVLSEFAAGSFMALLANPQARDSTITGLGRLLRGVHSLPIPAGAREGDGRVRMSDAAGWLGDDDAVPSFMHDAVRRELATTSPVSGRAPVLSHNDVNPSNLALDGERLLLLDWDVTSPNDPYYDLGTLAAFMRLDETSSLALLSAYEGHEVSELPPRFIADKRLVGVTVGTGFVVLARRSGHPGDAGATIESTVPLAEVSRKFRSGELSLATPAGQWLYGLGMVREAVLQPS